MPFLQVASKILCNARGFKINLGQLELIIISRIAEAQVFEHHQQATHFFVIVAMWKYQDEFFLYVHIVLLLKAFYFWITHLNCFPFLKDSIDVWNVNLALLKNWSPSHQILTVTFDSDGDDGDLKLVASFQGVCFVFSNFFTT